MARNTSDKSRRKWWSAAEVAEELGIAARTVYGWTTDPELIRMGGLIRVGRVVRLHWPTVQEWIRRKTLETAPLAAKDDRVYEWMRQYEGKRRGRPPKWLQAMRESVRQSGQLDENQGRQ